MESEDKIKQAFQSVKKDILEIKDHLLSLAERQERLEAALEDKKKVNSQKSTAHATDLVQIKDTKKSKKAAKKPAKKKAAKKSAKKKK